MISYEQLLDRIISDGIAEVRQAYADPKDNHKRDGAIEGFEECRGKSPSEIVTLWQAAESRCMRLRTTSADIKAYWKQRFKSLQLEWILNVLSVGLITNGQPPLLGHLPTARAAMKYAEVVGVKGAHA